MEEEIKKTVCDELVKMVLEEQIRHENSHYVINILEETGSVEVASRLIPVLKSQHKVSFIVAAKVIGHFGDETMIILLLPLIKSPVKEIQSAALAAIEEILRRARKV